MRENETGTFPFTGKRERPGLGGKVGQLNRVLLSPWSQEKKGIETGEGTRRGAHELLRGHPLSALGKRRVEPTRGERLRKQKFRLGWFKGVDIERAQNRHRRLGNDLNSDSSTSKGKRGLLNRDQARSQQLF